jgi:uncharacterized protein YkwD
LRSADAIGVRPRTILIAPIAALALALTLPAIASATCPNARKGPAQLTLRQARAAVVCSINRRRAARGLRRLRVSPKLTRSAQRHSFAMDAANFFSHDSLNGASFLDRIRRTGYLSRSDGWGVGENLMWGTGSAATPRRAVDAWMKSPGHRRTMLERRYRHLGIGVAFGMPDGGAGTSARSAAIYTADFGYR